MESNTYIMQQWFHIHEFYNNDKLIREIREVSDVYTKENFICYEFADEHLSYLQVTNYNNENKLPFIHFDKRIKIALDPMNKWPNVPNKMCRWEKDVVNQFKDFKHVKLAVSYFTHPIFQRFNRLKNGYKASFGIDIAPHPEFHFHIQDGMRLNLESLNCILYLKDKNLKEYEFSFNIKNELLFVDYEFTGNKYILNLDSKIFDSLLDGYDFSEIVFSYEVKNQEKFLIIPAFSYTVFSLSSLSLVNPSLLPFPFAIFLTVVALYLGLLKENYQIPYNRMVLMFFFLTCVSFMISMLKFCRII